MCTYRYTQHCGRVPLSCRNQCCASWPLRLAQLSEEREKACSCNEALASGPGNWEGCAASLPLCVCACVCVINVWDYKTKQLAQLYEYVMLCGGTPARFVSTYCFGSISPTCFLSTHCFVGTTPARIVSTHCSCCSLWLKRTRTKI